VIPEIPLDLDHGVGLKLAGVDDLMPIGEFSRRSGLSPKRLRAYAAAGLLVPAAIDSASSYRYYSPGQLRDAQLIDTLRQAGVELSEITALLRSPSPEKLDELAQRVVTEAGQRQDALRKARELLDVDSRPPSIRPVYPRGSNMAQFETAIRTETGERENNEDTVVASERLAMVADGMGGHPGGEIASRLAASVVEAAFTGRSVEELEAAVRAANRAIWERGGSTEQLGGMGTTICVAGVTEDAGIAVVNVGDSRAYLLHNGSLVQLTEDHSLTAELVRRGELNEDEAAGHPQRNVLTRALGVAPDVRLDSAVHRLETGDRLLLCTDGLFNEVAVHEMEGLMTREVELGRIAEGLVDLAIARGARDNVSVVVGIIA
jgi:serine/threonine protein phosphatase PrpC